MKTEGWEQRLTAEIEEAEQKTFSWGQHDCALFVQDCYLAVTGKNWAIGNICGDYKTALGAMRLIKKMNCNDLREAAILAFGDCLKTPFLAQRGDIVLLNAPDKALGICIGADAVFVSTQGLTHRSLSDCSHAWKAA